jgi:hypothetical protein
MLTTLDNEPMDMPATLRLAKKQKRPKCIVGTTTANRKHYGRSKCEFIRFALELEQSGVLRNLLG